MTTERCECGYSWADIEALSRALRSGSKEQRLKACLDDLKELQAVLFAPEQFLGGQNAPKSGKEDVDHHQ